MLNFESRKKLAQSVHEAFEANDVHFIISKEAQRCPDTFVAVAYLDDDLKGLDGVTGDGWSRVSYPDVFSADGGRTIAINDALHDLIGKMWHIYHTTYIG